MNKELDNFMDTLGESYKSDAKDIVRRFSLKMSIQKKSNREIRGIIWRDVFEIIHDSGLDYVLDLEILEEFTNHQTLLSLRNSLQARGIR